MKIIGVTGGFGTGKTTAAKYFKQLGAVVLDADEIAHAAISKKGGAYKKVLKIFGRGILKKNGEIDRRRLGEIVFCAAAGGSPLKRLCAAVHPVVIRDIKGRLKKIKKETPYAIVVLDAPLLVEAGLLGLIDKLIVVKAGRGLQIFRCREKTGLDREEILGRIKAQLPIKEKIRVADFIIDNSGTKEKTKREVKKTWEKIQQ